jgi:hypothetical protein
MRASSDLRGAGDGRQSTLISPEVAEPVGRKLGVPDGVLDVLVAEIVLQGSGIVPVVGKLLTHQPTDRDRLARGVARRKLVAGRQRLRIGVQKGTGTDEQRGGTALNERCKGCLDVALAAGIECDELLPDRLRRGLQVASLRHGLLRRSGGAGQPQHPMIARFIASFPLLDQAELCRGSSARRSISVRIASSSSSSC